MGGGVGRGGGRKGVVVVEGANPRRLIALQFPACSRLFVAIVCACAQRQAAAAAAAAAAAPVSRSLLAGGPVTRLSCRFTERDDARLEPAKTAKRWEGFIDK